MSRTIRRTTNAERLKRFFLLDQALLEEDSYWLRYAKRRYGFQDIGELMKKQEALFHADGACGHHNIPAELRTQSHRRLRAHFRAELRKALCQPERDVLRTQPKDDLAWQCW